MVKTRFYPWVGKIPWRREWLSTPVFLPGKSHGQRSLAGYSPWGQKESDTTEQLTQTLQIPVLGYSFSECDSLQWRWCTTFQPVLLNFCIFPIVHSFCFSILVWKGSYTVIVTVYLFSPVVYKKTQMKSFLAQILRETRSLRLPRMSIILHPLVLF